MSQYNRSYPWGYISPLMSLTGIPLMVAASGRLSFSVVVCLLLPGIYAFTLSIIHLGKPIIPEKYRNIIIIMILTFISSFLYLIVKMIHPVFALELYFIIFLIPLTFLSSEIVQRTDKLSLSEGIVLGIKEALILGGLIIAVSLIREPLGYGTFSIPFMGKTVNILPDALRERLVLQIFAAPPGGFIITACLIAVIQCTFAGRVSPSISGDNDD